MVIVFYRVVNFYSTNYIHQPCSFCKRYNYFLIVEYIIKLQHIFFSVFQPFLSRLVTTDVKFPGGLWYIGEVLSIVDVRIARGSVFKGCYCQYCFYKGRLFVIRFFSSVISSLCCGEFTGGICEGSILPPLRKVVAK